MVETVKLEPLDKSEDQIENVHNATLKRTLVYKGQLPRPGHCWFVFDINGKHHAEKQGGKLEPGKKYRKLQGGLQVEKNFCDEHGDENVKAMIIVNILNKRKFFK